MFKRGCVNGDAPFCQWGRPFLTQMSQMSIGTLSIEDALLCQKGASPLTAQLTASNYAKNILATFKKNVEKATFKDILIVLKNAFFAIDKL